MARKAAAAAVAGDPVAARIAVLARLQARRPESRVRTYANVDGGGHDLKVTDPPADDRMPPRDLGEWADDRVWGMLGGRTGLNPAEQAACEILESFRSGDPDTVSRAVGRAGSSLDVHLRYLVSGLLSEWRSGAPAYAVSVTAAAAAQARRLGWDRPPRRGRRGPEPLSQTPGRQV
jgi:hypothetical protein